MRNLAWSRTRLVTWQFWIYFFRLVTSLYVAVIMSMQLQDLSRYLRFYTNGKLALVMGSLQLAFWITLALNDIFMLTIDYKRTDTYMGCVITQTVASIATMIVTVIALILQPEWDTYAWVLMYQINAGNLAARHRSTIGFILIGIPALWDAILSLCLLGVMLWPIFLSRPNISISQVWKRNTKELLTGITAPWEAHTISISGHPRELPLSMPTGVAVRRVKRFFANLFFRRVSPVESRMYAFSRNMFSALAISILIIRTITALLNAQNQIGTRMVSTVCSGNDASRLHRIQVLVEHILNPNPANVILVKGQYSNDSCEIEDSQILPYSGRNLSMTIFNCHLYTTGPFVDYESEPNVFRVEVRSAGLNTSAPLVSLDMPRIWLLNGYEKPSVVAGDSVGIYAHAARTYLPAWELHRGFHIEAEAKLITRKSIKSSIWRDILLRSEPIYHLSSLYPIVESSVGIVNYLNSSIATATVTTTLKPGFMYFRNQAGVPGPLALTSGICDVLEDYRSSTVLDVLGTIGGLFALLQTAHILLFGRPLIWGLTGAKLITPFGLLGACSSRGFKRRLREQYHTKSKKDQSEKILIGAFLRDFVIDFGPADVEQEYRASQNSSLTEDTTEVQVPLMGLDTTVTPTLRSGRDSDAE